MKVTITVIFLFVGLFNASSQGIVFETSSWQSVLARAKQESKLIFIDCYTVWCKPCKWMDANIFPLKAVGEFYNGEFINVKMDMEKGDGIEIAKKYNINSFPTYLILDDRGNVIHRDGGAMDESKFISLAKLALDPSKNLSGMNAEYEKGNRNREFLRKFIITLGKGRQKEKQKRVFESYYSSYSNDLLNKQDFDVIMSVVEPEDEAFLILLKNREAYKQLVGEKEFDFRIYTKFILPFGKILSTEGVEALRIKAEKYKPFYPRIIQRTEDLAILRWYNKKKMTEHLAKACINFVQTYSPDDISEILYYMNRIAEAAPMEAAKYTDAVLYMEEIVKRYPNNFALADVYASLLYKNGKKQEAIQWAKKVVEDMPEEKKDKLWSSKLLEEAGILQ